MKAVQGRRGLLDDAHDPARHLANFLRGTAASGLQQTKATSHARVGKRPRQGSCSRSAGRRCRKPLTHGSGGDRAQASRNLLKSLELDDIGALQRAGAGPGRYENEPRSALQRMPSVIAVKVGRPRQREQVPVRPGVRNHLGKRRPLRERAVIACQPRVRALVPRVNRQRVK
jgi:hypothetical protein